MLNRRLTLVIKAALKDTPVVLINGARQVGKSTLALMINEMDYHYVTFDDINELTTAKLNLQSYIDNIKKPVVFDEVQRLPEIFVAIKTSVDRDRKPGQFLLTGSANVLLLPKLSDSLAGRMQIETLWPLSQGEILGYQESFLSDLMSGKIHEKHISTTELNSLGASILTGGYPEVVAREQFERKTAWFRSYLSTIIQRDIRDLANIDKLTEIPGLIKLLASRCSSLLNFSELSRSAGIAMTTLKRYVTLLETIFQVYRLLPWAKNVSKRFIKTPKLMFTDTGILCHLLSLSPDKLMQSENLFGRVLENFVINELHKQASWMITPPTFSHFRTQTGVEVDLIIETPDSSLIAIEIKRSLSVSKNDFKGLEYFEEVAGRKFQMGIVLYCGREVIHYKDKFYAMPISILWRHSRPETTGIAGK